jgi:hypothetical protein
VQRVGRFGGDFSIAPRGRKRQDGVRRVIEGMKDIVRRAGVIGLLSINLQRDGGRSHPGLQRSRVLRAYAPQQGERIKGGGLQILRSCAQISETQE